MNRTWKDAWCEILWNYFVQRFAANCTKCSIWLRGFQSKDFYFEVERQFANFTAFHAAFMKWLDESEAKR